MFNHDLSRVNKAVAAIAAICFCSTISFAQSSGKEATTKTSTAPACTALKLAMPVPPKEDVEKLINLALSLADKATDPAAAEKASIVAYACKASIGQADEALAQADKLKTPLAKARLNIIVAYNLIKANKFEHAKKCITDALKQLNEDDMHNPQCQLVFIYAARSLFNDLNNPKEAISLCDKLCDEASKAGKINMEVGAISWQIFLKAGEYEKAIKLMEFLKKQHVDFECQTYCEIACNKAEHKDSAGAKEALDQAQAILYQKLISEQNPHDFKPFIKACIKIGDVARAKLVIDKLKDKVDVHLKKETEIQTLTSFSIPCLADSYDIAGDQANLDKLIDIVSQKKPAGKDYFSIEPYCVSMIYLLSLKKEYPKAMEYYDMLMKSNNAPEDMGNIHGTTLHNTFEKMDNTKDVLVVMQRVITIQSDIFKPILFQDGINVLCKLGSIDIAKKYLSDLVKYVNSNKIPEDMLLRAQDRVVQCYTIIGDIAGLIEYAKTITDQASQLRAAIEACKILTNTGMLLRD